MDRISVAEAGRHFEELVERVSRQGVTVELERDDRIVARLSPVGRRLQAKDLQRFFTSLPPLGDDADAFARDLETIRHAIPQESDPWA